jgi:RND family efflux transporter MFP subunit
MWCAGTFAGLLLAACGPAAEPPREVVRPVRTVTVQMQEGGESVSLTGQIHAQEELSLAFRVSGRLIERPVNVGDRLEPGQLVGRVESITAQNAVQAARANLAAADAQLMDARLEFDRQQTLFSRGVAARAVYDRARAAHQTARARVDAARAELDTAREQLGYTELRADSAGAVTARGAEPGEVVAAGQMIVRVARKSGRDAVLDMPARVKELALDVDPEVTVALVSDPKVRTTGRVREVSPQADPVTRTFTVRVGLTDPPEAMRLGSTVTGTMLFGGAPGMLIPASALTAAKGEPAVWLVDPATSTVSLRNVEVERFAVADVLVASGLAPDDVVVTAGVQALRPGQKVRLLVAEP